MCARRRLRFVGCFFGRETLALAFFGRRLLSPTGALSGERLELSLQTKRDAESNAAKLETLIGPYSASAGKLIDLAPNGGVFTFVDIDGFQA